MNEQPTPARSRAVFSTEDFELMKEAVADYIKKIQDEKVRQAFGDACARRGGFKPSTGKTY